MYTCTKRFSEICVAHRNWKAATHCAKVHGYARTVELTLSCTHLSHEDWVVDLGDLKDIRKWLEGQWDHKLLLSDDDPLLEEFRQMERLGAMDLNILPREKGWGPSLEESCKFLADHIQPMLQEKTQGRCFVTKIEIWEKTDNRCALVLNAPH